MLERETSANTHRFQQGFAPLIVIIGTLAVLSLATASTARVADNSVPGDPLFGLDKALEKVEIRLATNEQARVKAHLKVAQERLEELATTENKNRPIDAASAETQQAVAAATAAVSKVAIEFKENKIKLASTDMQALLTELQKTVAAHQGLIRRIKIKLEDGQSEAIVKLLEEDAEELEEHLEEDLDDIKDDGQLNASTADKLKVKFRGTLKKTGSSLQVTLGDKTYTLSPSSTAGNLETHVGKQIKIEGTAAQSAPTAITVVSVEVQEDGNALEQPEVETKGTIRRSGNLFVLALEGTENQQTLSSPAISLTPFVDKFVKIKGKLTSTALTVQKVELRETSAPAISSTTRIRNEVKVKVDQAGDVKIRTNIQNSTGGSTNGSSGADDIDEDDEDEKEDEDDEEEKEDRSGSNSGRR